MRPVYSLGFTIALAFALTGCTNNVKKSEELTDQIIVEMNKIADAVEKGDKAGWEASMTKMRQIAQEGKNLKVTTQQSNELEAKFKPKFDEVGKRMQKSFAAGMASGKIKPDELLKLGEEMTKLGNEMQKMGK